MDTIQNIVIDKITDTAPLHTTENIWLWIALAELAVIVALVVLVSRKTKKQNLLEQKFKADALQQEIDMNDVMGNIFQAKQLYDQLKRSCHPDRFTDRELRLKADALFQQITENKRNYSRLQELKAQAEKELMINH